MAANCEDETTNYFDKLPDELIIKIFRHFLDNSDLGDEESPWKLRLSSKTSKPIQWPSIRIAKVYNRKDDCLSYNVKRNFLDGSDGSECLRILCLTSKRFARIINGSSFTTKNLEQWPSIIVDCRKSIQPHEHNKKGSCFCHIICGASGSKFMKYRKLELYSCDLLTSCLRQTIKDERVGLNTVVELILSSCKLSPVILDNILAYLPNIERVSITLNYSLGSDNAEQPEHRELAGLILSTLTLKIISFSNNVPLVEYILPNLPARDVRMEISLNQPESNAWVRNYLKRHRKIIRNFHVTASGLDKLSSINEERVSRIFDGFDYYVEQGIYKWRIISSRQPQESQSFRTNLEPVKYKRLELHWCEISDDNCALEAIKDDSACLSEVVELSLHGCVLSNHNFSTILAFLPNMKNLSIYGGSMRDENSNITVPQPAPRNLTLSSLYLAPSYYSQYNLLLQYVREYLPAQNVRFRVNQTSYSDPWIGEYLSKHEDTIRDFILSNK